MPTITRLRDKRPKREYNNSEGKRAERHAIYDTTRWRRLAHAKFIDSPLCECCLERGIATPAEEIHHRVSFMTTEDPEKRIALAYDYNNLMSLCRECHHRLHAGGGRGGMG